MSKKFTLLVVAIAVVAFAAMPALASAAPSIDTSTGKTIKFSGTSGAATLRASGLPNVNCKKDKNTGSLENGTTGTVEISFEECTESLTGSKCTTSGSATGTITTGTSVFHLVYIKGFTKTVGVLVTPPTGGVFAKFTCNSIIPVTIEVKGNGVIGHVDSPACGASSSTFIASFTASGSTQTYREVEGEATVYSLTANGTTASEEGTETGAIQEGASAKLTCN